MTTSTVWLQARDLVLVLREDGRYPGETVLVCDLFPDERGGGGPAERPLRSLLLRLDMANAFLLSPWWVHAVLLQEDRVIEWRAVRAATRPPALCIDRRRGTGWDAAKTLTALGFAAGREVACPVLRSRAELLAAAGHRHSLPKGEPCPAWWSYRSPAADGARVMLALYELARRLGPNHAGLLTRFPADRDLLALHGGDGVGLRTLVRTLGQPADLDRRRVVARLVPTMAGELVTAVLRTRADALRGWSRSMTLRLALPSTTEVGLPDGHPLPADLGAEVKVFPGGQAVQWWVPLPEAEVEALDALRARLLAGRMELIVVDPTTQPSHGPATVRDRLAERAHTSIVVRREVPGVEAAGEVDGVRFVTDAVVDALLAEVEPDGAVGILFTHVVLVDAEQYSAVRLHQLLTAVDRLRSRWTDLPSAGRSPVRVVGTLDLPPPGAHLGAFRELLAGGGAIAPPGRVKVFAEKLSAQWPPAEHGAVLRARVEVRSEGRVTTTTTTPHPTLRPADLFTHGGPPVDLVAVDMAHWARDEMVALLLALARRPHHFRLLTAATTIGQLLAAVRRAPPSYHERRGL